LLLVVKKRKKILYNKRYENEKDDYMKLPNKKEIYKSLKLTNNIKKEDFYDMWEKLSNREKEIFFLKNIKGLKYNEIVSALNLLTDEEQIRIEKAKKRLWEDRMNYIARNISIDE
jgi:DNA-directed RNA polymerase specialized sigma24 family protein